MSWANVVKTKLTKSCTSIIVEYSPHVHHERDTKDRLQSKYNDGIPRHREITPDPADEFIMHSQELDYLYSFTCTVCKAAASGSRRQQQRKRKPTPDGRPRGVSRFVALLVTGFVRRSSSTQLLQGHVHHISWLCLRFYQRIIAVHDHDEQLGHWFAANVLTIEPIQWLLANERIIGGKSIQPLTQCVSDEYQLFLCYMKRDIKKDIEAIEYLRVCLGYDTRYKQFVLIKAHNDGKDLQLLVSTPVRLEAYYTHWNSTWNTEPWKATRRWSEFASNLWKLFVTGRLYDAQRSHAEQRSLWELLEFLFLLQDQKFAHRYNSSSGFNYCAKPRECTLPFRDQSRLLVTGTYDEYPMYPFEDEEEIKVLRKIQAEIKALEDGAHIEYEKGKRLECTCFALLCFDRYRYSARYVYRVEFALQNVDEPAIQLTSTLLAEGRYWR